METLRKALPFYVLSLFLLWLLHLQGCAAEGRYTYEQIRATYGVEKSYPPSGPPEGSGPGVGTPSGPLGLKEAIKMALTNNPEMDRAIARIGQSEATVDQARASFWPVLSAYGEYLQGDAPSSYLFKTIDQRNLPPGVHFNDPGWFENYEVGIQGRMNLFNGGKDLLRKRMSEKGLKVQELDRETLENSLITSVVQTYFNILATREYIQIARESVATVETQLRIMQVRFEAGGALKSDILSLRVRMAQAREDLVRAENDYSLSLAAMNHLLGLDPDTPIEVRAGEDVPKDLPREYGTGLLYALTHRPELMKVRQQLVQSRMALDMGRSQYSPRLDFLVKYYLDDESLDVDRERENWTAGLFLHWDLFTGWSTRAEIRKAEAFLKEMLAADRQATQAVLLDLKTAYLKLTEAEARVVVASAAVEEARESLQLVKRQYEGGSATITRYLEAELARNRTRIRSAAAFYDRTKALAELGRALGYWGGYAREGVTDDTQ